MNQFDEGLQALGNVAQNSNVSASGGVDGGQSGTEDTVSGAQFYKLLKKFYKELLLHFKLKEILF